MRRMAKIEFGLLSLLAAGCALFSPPAIITVYVGFAIMLALLAIIV